MIPTQAFIPVQAKQEHLETFPDFFGKNLFGVNPSSDYFEQAQTRHREEKIREEPSDEISENKENDEESEEAEENSEYNQPGPNYISHELPAKIPHQVETVKIQEKNYKSGLNSIPTTTKIQDLRDYKDHHKYLSPIQQSIAPQIYPQALGYQKFTQTSAVPSLSPYQKYSFQPVVDYNNKYLENLNSESNVRPSYRSKFARMNVSPYLSQESKAVPKTAELKNCKRLTKDSGTGKSGDLTCFVCENEETNSKVTECSYQSEPANTDLHKGSSERYSIPARQPDGFRYRRYASEDNSDPYEYVKNRSLGEEKENQEEGDNYEYEGYDASQPEKSYSEIQSDEILKDPKKCTNVNRDGMTCRVCKDPATGGNYESCSFSSAPEPEKYAYVSEKNYNSNDDPDYASKGDESKNVPTNSNVDDEFNDEKVIKKEKKQKKKNSKNSELKKTKGSKSEYSDYEHPQILEKKGYGGHYQSKGEKSSYPKYEAESRQQPQVDENEEDTKSSSDSADDVSPYKDLGEYKFEYFPEFSSEESKTEEEPAYAGTSKKEVEQVLADFEKKDRSKCKQVKKNGMTCFLCVDQNKVKNEECMFISESRPKGTYAKYTKTDELGVSSETKPVAAVTKLVSNRKKRSEKKMNEITAADSSKIEKVVKKYNQKLEPEVLELRASASAQDAQRIQEKDDEPKLETPQEFDTTDEGGAYSAETRPVYSKALGMTLPKYMLDKSDFEKEFDALLVHN